MHASNRYLIWLGALRDSGVLSPKQYQRLSACTPKDLHPLEWLAKQGLSSPKDAQPMHEDQLLDWLSDTTKIPIVKIDPLQLDFRSISNTVPMRFSRHHQILVLSASTKSITVACSDPFCIKQWHTELSTALGKTLKIRLAHPKDIRTYLDTLYPLDRSIKHIAQSNKSAEETESLPLLRLNNDDLDNTDSKESAMILTNRLLCYALERGASDIHLEPRETWTHVRLRIDGLLYHLLNLPSSAAQVVSHRLKVLALMDTTEKRRPQDGYLRTVQANGETLELRLSTLATAYGEKLVLRLLNPSMLRQDSATLGMDKQTQQHWQAILHRGRGLVLVTGPTGSGKTTTLYNVLYQLDSKKNNICTIEDPVEMVEPRFNQTQARPDIGLDFATGVRALMRQDPDVIMIGEIRDLATAKAAIQAALTGHQVFASMHTDNSLSSITRLSDIGIPDYLLRATLTGVLNQRLLPRLCTYCKQETQTDQRLWPLLNNKASPPTLYAARGCTHCHYSGLNGRVGVFESLFINLQLRALISPSEQKHEHFIKRAQNSKQWVSLQENVISLLRNGVIDIRSALSISEEAI